MNNTYFTTTSIDNYSDLKYYYHDNKKVFISSFFNSNTINKDVAEYQKQVFNKFSITLNQFDDEIRHPDYMNYVMNHIDSDIYIFFDIDCIPLKNKVIEKILYLVDNNSIFGVSQCDNSNDLNHIYAAPSCFGINKVLYENLRKPSFVERQRYMGYNNQINKTISILKAHGIENIGGLGERFYELTMSSLKHLNIKLICDTAEELTYLCEESRHIVNLWHPTSSDNNIWKLGNSGLTFGNGTIYNHCIYHAFQIRNENERFINKCKEMLNEKN
jgi:hypothetical protein